MRGNSAVSRRLQEILDIGRTIDNATQYPTYLRYQKLGEAYSADLLLLAVQSAYVPYFD